MSRPFLDTGHDPRFRRVGWRARIGLITPFAGLAATADFHRVAPEGVALALGHLSRPLTHDTVAQLSEVGGQVAEAARRLARVKADVILWNTTSGSLIKGPGYDQELIRIMEEASGTPSTTASTVMIDAFRKVGAKRICLATPYVDEVNELEKQFIESHGFEVARYRGLQILDVREIVDLPAAELHRLAREVDVPEADCVFISCAGLSVLGILGVLEAELGKPVLSTNQVSLWGAFRMAGVTDSIRGFGTLLEGG